jgi:hypothetical protein
MKITESGPTGKVAPPSRTSPCPETITTSSSIRWRWSGIWSPRDVLDDDCEILDAPAIVPRVRDDPQVTRAKVVGVVEKRLERCGWNVRHRVSLRRSLLAPIVALAGPRREEKKDLCAFLASHEMALVGLEVDEGSDGRFDLFSTCADPGGAVDDDDPRMLFHLMVAELLTGVEADEDGARLVFTQEDDGGAAPSGGVDRGQRPALHAWRILGRIVP